MVAGGKERAPQKVSHGGIRGHENDFLVAEGAPLPHDTGGVDAGGVGSKGRALPSSEEVPDRPLQDRQLRERFEEVGPGLVDGARDHFRLCHLARSDARDLGLGLGPEQGLPQSIQAHLLVRKDQGLPKGRWGELEDRSPFQI